MENKFAIPLTNEDRIFVEFKTDRGKVDTFVVKLICDIHGHSYEVIRFDGAHGGVHMDILDIEGKVFRKVWYYYVSNDQGLTMAIADIKGNFEIYRERYIKWLRLN